VKLVISPQAADDIEVAMRWWAANRPSAPDLLEREWLRALEFVSTAPSGCAGLGLRSPKLRNVRRVPLPKTRYLLYYRVMETEVRVLRLWHASRGVLPKL